MPEQCGFLERESESYMEIWNKRSRMSLSVTTLHAETLNRMPSVQDNGVSLVSPANNLKNKKIRILLLFFCGSVVPDTLNTAKPIK
jgi:hypothetical protein